MSTIATHRLPGSVLTPNYDRRQIKPRMIHFGFGAFHRAHQALYTDDLLNRHDSDWGYCAVSLFGGEALIQQLRQQNHLYSVVEKGAVATSTRIIGSVCGSLHPNQDGKSGVLLKMTDPLIAIVSMTITEKGYCIDPATGQLDLHNSLIRHDIEHPHEPDSAIGYIVEALRLRRQHGISPFTVMSCDNLQNNGRVAKAAVVGLARMHDHELAEWIDTQVTFPCTMVDRIVPAATQATLDEIHQLLGVADPCGISCEPFRQWVIEDNFVAGRPDWNLAGAQFVDDVAPYEEMKLRMLNGSHSFLAYLGYLGGYAHIADTMTDPSYRKAAREMMLKAQAPSLNMPQGTDLDAYAELLLERYANPRLKHRTWQIAMDGSQKIPQRLGGSLQHHLAQGTDFRWLAAAIAAWMFYVSGKDEQGHDIEVCDPMAAQLKGICDAHGKKATVVPALLAIDSIFPTAIGQNKRVIDAVTAAYQCLVDQGARATVAAL